MRAVWELPVLTLWVCVCQGVLAAAAACGASCGPNVAQVEEVEGALLQPLLKAAPASLACLVVEVEGVVVLLLHQPHPASLP
jgi:hypothetical protein